MSAPGATPNMELPPRRVVLLGASNVIRSVATVVETARCAWGGPLDVLAACGHGRSYGQASLVLVRSLPGIVECGLWDDLAARPNVPTAALLTDVGNDLLYGASPERIAGWVETCLARLAPRCERIVVTELPLESTSRLGKLRYLAIRSVLFPQSKLDYSSAVAKTAELNDRVVEAARRFGASVVRPRLQWYGWDPIHVSRASASRAWREILAAWCVEETLIAPRASLRQWLRLRFLHPQQMRFFGRERHCPQPARTLRDGSWISFY